MRLIRQMMVAALTLGCGAQAAPAQERLLFTSLSPGGSPNSVFFNAWAQRVNDQSAGTLKVEVRDGVSLATFGNSYDRVMADVVQIGWVQPAFVAGKFPLSEITNLPFMTDDDVHCSMALSRYFKSAVLQAELKDVVPVWTSCLAQTGLHFAKPLRSDTDLGGLKLRVAGKVPSQIVERMGGQPVSMTAEQSTNPYSAAQSTERSPRGPPSSHTSCKKSRSTMSKFRSAARPACS